MKTYGIFLLLSLSSHAFADVSKSKCVNLYNLGANIYSQSDVKKLRAKYQTLEQNIYWKSYVEDMVDVTQLIHTDIQKENTDKGSPKKNFELFGVDNYKAYVAARNYLNAIPEGSLHLSADLIKQVHTRSASGLKKELNFFQKIFSSMFVEPGLYKKRNNFGNDPIQNPLSEEQYLVLKANPYTKFIELPWPFSRVGKRRGSIRYGEQANVEKDIKTLCDWANRQLAKVKSGEVDAIALAAEFQWHYVSIHPMVDGNGRTSMLLANRILEEADLPPVMMTMTGFDIYFTPQVWAEKIKASIFDFEQMISDPVFKAYIEKETPNLFMSNFVDGPRLALTAESARGAQKRAEVQKLNGKILGRWPILKRELFAENESQEVIIGNQRFVAMFDGFFYDKNGIPYAIHSESKGSEKIYTLYPISDQTAFLYSMGGKSTSEKRFFKRGMNPFMRDHFQEFFGFLKLYSNGGADRTRNIEVIDYSAIAKVNKTGEVFVYDWQRPLLKSAFEIKDTDPMKVLAPTRGYHTQFEKSVHFGDKTNLHEVLAQYQLMELRFFKYEKYTERNGMTEETQIIRTSRKKLFDAAKSLLAERVVTLEKALQTSPHLFPTSQEWHFFLAYYHVSPMKYANFEAFFTSPDNSKITLLRADQGSSQLTGFVSNTFFREFLDSIPKNELIKAYVGKIAQAVEAKNPTSAQLKFLATSLPFQILKANQADYKRSIRNLNRVVQMSKYDTRGMAKEFDRASFEQHLHSVNDPFKSNVSFSTNSAIYIRTKRIDSDSEMTSEAKEQSRDIIPFTFDSTDARVFFVRLNKTDVDVNEVTGYFRQYEVLKPTFASPLGITRSFSNEFFNADGATPTDKAELKKRTEFEEPFISIESQNSSH